MMRIAEIYKSVQGEGVFTGTSSVFVRASGCNLRCWFCDTPYTSWSAEGEDIAVAEVLSRVAEFDEQHVVVTGGEPMLYSELIPLCDGLADADHHVTIETAGTLDLPIRCDLMSISPKLSNSTPSAERAGGWRDRHERGRHVPKVVRRLVNDYSYQIKFVIECPDDCDEVVRYLEEFPEIHRDRVHLMPQGVDIEHLAEIARWLEPLCVRHGYRFCPRKHIEWFGAVRGT